MISTKACFLCRPNLKKTGTQGDGGGEGVYGPRTLINLLQSKSLTSIGTVAGKNACEFSNYILPKLSRTLLGTSLIRQRPRPVKRTRRETKAKSAEWIIRSKSIHQVCYEYSPKSHSSWRPPNRSSKLCADHRTGSNHPDYSPVAKSKLRGW